MPSPTAIKCPQPKALDEFTIIQDPQPQYQFRDYFTVTCKQGYQLMEVRGRSSWDRSSGCPRRKRWADLNWSHGGWG
jgi:hypothetical protein